MRTMGSGGIVAFPGDRGGTTKDTKNTNKGEEGGISRMGVSPGFTFLTVHGLNFVGRS